MNYSNRGDIGAIDSKMCSFMKITFLCAAQMFAEIIPNHEKYPWMKGKTDTELYHSIKGIRQLFKNITI